MNCGVKAAELHAPTRDIFASDDLVRRAENIVWSLGFRGATGDLVLGVRQVLKAYAELDARTEGTEKTPQSLQVGDSSTENAAHMKPSS